MDLKKFLKDNPLISQADLAVAMYGDDKPRYNKNKLSNKLNEVVQGNSKQRITPKDEQLALEALKKLGYNISQLDG
ncbi:hypothetical protein [Pedobacter punctiformis]|uniref:Uncharacterized protein n=1 Tax=Pedobacter punctiformis TaxID=3004097 RepID=A0ABT4LAN1_9SPHI|nr:hypothetical protein [Pedobacter sp. HCMS5-2]MCZ4244958.1 hypothetical protein [Pedobacter sp. HCMS5-2]